MKLRNKKTGEIGKPAFIGVDYEITILPEDKNKKARYYKTLAELNAEWEDAPEEPKEYWYIGDGGEIYGFSDYYLGTEIEETHRKIGNLFETREEAEKAVEKLKAWKRLKDYDLHIEFANSPEYDEDDDCWHCSVDFSVRAGDDGDKLLNLLFGGGE